MYFVTTVHIEKNEIVRQRCVGYFMGLDDAINIVINNVGDIYENGYYSHAVIENVYDGLYQHDLNPIWFEWQDEGEESGYWRIEAPKATEHLVGFCFG